MTKSEKLKKLIGATVTFYAETPNSNAGQQYQQVVLKVESVVETKNGDTLVKGISLKRIETSNKIEYRQYNINRIFDRTLAIVTDNEWSSINKQLLRLGDSRLRDIDELPQNKKLTIDFSKLKKC